MSSNLIHYFTHNTPPKYLALAEAGTAAFILRKIVFKKNKGDYAYISSTCKTHKILYLCFEQ